MTAFVVDLDDVVSGMQKGSDLFAIEGAPVVVVAAFFSVDMSNELTAGVNVQAGRIGCGVEMEGIPEMGDGPACRGAGKPEPADGGKLRLSGMVLAGNPLRLPVREAGFKPCRRGGSFLTLVVPRPDDPLIALLRLERGPGVDDVDRFGRGDTAGVPGIRLAGLEVR